MRRNRKKKKKEGKKREIEEEEDREEDQEECVREEGTSMPLADIKSERVARRLRKR